MQQLAINIEHSQLNCHTCCILELTLISWYFICLPPPPLPTLTIDKGSQSISWLELKVLNLGCNKGEYRTLEWLMLKIFDCKLLHQHSFLVGSDTSYFSCQLLLCSEADPGGVFGVSRPSLRVVKWCLLHSEQWHYQNPRRKVHGGKHKSLVPNYYVASRDDNSCD